MSCQPDLNRLGAHRLESVTNRNPRKALDSDCQVFLNQECRRFRNSACRPGRLNRKMPRERMRQPEEPSTWSKFTGGTKDLFSKTKQTLMPWTQDDEETTVRRPAPPRRSPSKPSNRHKRPTGVDRKEIDLFVAVTQRKTTASNGQRIPAQPRLN